jgi:glycosyltransferase involved in cell wall biosynthesis
MAAAKTQVSSKCGMGIYVQKIRIGPLNILFAVHHLPPRYKGGAEQRAHRTALALQRRGHSTRMICVEYIDRGPSSGVEWQDDEYDGVAVRRLSFNLNAAPNRFLWEYDNPWIGDHLRQWMSDLSPDVFHLVGGYLLTASALEAAQALNIPTVVSLSDFWWICAHTTMLRSDNTLSTLPIDPLTCARCLGEEQRRYRIPGRLAPGLMQLFWKTQRRRIQQVRARSDRLREVLNRAHAIISPSQFLRSMYIGAGVNANKLFYSRQGRDFPDLQASLLEKHPANQLRVGYIGQIAWLKGIHVLFEAVRRLPDANLEVKAYGNPNSFPEYTARLKRIAAGDRRLELAGVYLSDEVSRVMKNMDVMVIPSVCYENSPNAILEAFAHKTPVIASNQGGMAELITHETNGLLFQPGDPADLARQLQRLLDDPGLLPRLRAGIAPVKTVAEEIDELVNVYEGI